MKIFTQGRYATVASTAGLVVALGGTSYAAVMITGHDIKNGTVTTRDVKNHNLEVKDLSTGAKRHLRGHPGAAGPQGPAGPQGSQGPAGPSNAYSVYNDDYTNLTPDPKVVLSLPVPAGDYVVDAQAEYSANGASATCWITAAGRYSDGHAVIGAGQGTTSIPAHTVFTTATDTTVTYTCNGTAGVVWLKRLTAIKLGSLVDTHGPIVN